MPKFKIVCFILAAILAAVGTVVVLRNLRNDFVPPDKADITDRNTYLDKTPDMDITDPDADVREFLFVAHKQLLSGSGFKGISRGTSTAMMGIKQNVLNTRYVIGEFGNKSVLKEMVTKGAVSNAYQLYLVGTGANGNYIYRDFDRVNDIDDVDWSDTAVPLQMQAFYNRFGHRSDKLTSYILNWDTVTMGEFVSEESGLYTFRYVLDKETATEDIRYEMVTNGNLEVFPEFEKCEIYVTMDADFNVHSLRTDCRYVAATMGIKSGCTEDITETFEDYDGQLPETDFFSPYLGQTGGDLEEKPTALKMLTSMFAPYLNGETLQAKINVTNGGAALTDALVSLSGLDISDLSDLAVDLRLGKLNASYKHGAGKLLLNYEDFNASTTVNGVMELAGTFSSLLSGDMPAAVSETEQSGFDVADLLNDLTYQLSDDESVCTVSLPLRLGDVELNASLVGLFNGEGYVFSYADIDVGEVNAHVELQSWTPTAVDANAPEILGLADLIRNGKLSLTADVDLPIGDRSYAVNAELLGDLSKLAVQARLTLGNNGELNVSYVDDIAYIAFGNVKFKLDMTQTDQLKSIVEKLVADLGTAQSPSQNSASDVKPEQLLALFNGFEAVSVGQNKVAMVLSLGEMQITVNLVARENRWNVEGISADGYGVNANVAPSNEYADVNAPADAQNYVDVTRLVDVFDNPISDLLHANTFGVDFTFYLTLGGKTYRADGSVALDPQGTVNADVVIYDGDVGIVNANVVYTDGTVYLTLNGVKAAFAVGAGSADTDVAQTLAQLVSDEKLQQLLDEHQDIKQLVGAICKLAQEVKDFDISDLFNTDFTTVVSKFTFENDVLSVTAQGDAFGFDGVSVSFDLYVQAGKLGVRLNDLQLGNATLDGEIALVADAQVTLPVAEDYVLNLRGTLNGAQVNITLDLVQMDIWASVHIRNEQLLVRYADGKFYAIYGGAKIAVDTAKLGTFADKLKQLTQDAPQLPAVDVLAVLAAFGADLQGDDPNLSFNGAGISARLNFANADGLLVFDNAQVTFDVNGTSYTATLEQVDEKATQLDTQQTFVDGNELLEQIVDTVTAFTGADGLQLRVDELNLQVGEKRYKATLVVTVNGGVRVQLTLRDAQDEQVLVSADVTYVDENGILYLDIDGVRQAVKLTSQKQPQGDGASFAQILGALQQFRGVNAVLDSLLDVVDDLPDNADEIVFSEFIADLYQADGKLYAQFDLEQLGLKGVTVALSLGEKVELNLNELAIGDVVLNADVNIARYDDKVTAPEGTFVTEFTLDLGNGITGNLHLNCLDGEFYGELTLANGEKALFQVESDGKVYVQYGNLAENYENVCVLLDLNNASSVLGALGKLITLPQRQQTAPQDAVDVLKTVLSALVIERQPIDGGFAWDVNYNGVSAKLRFAADKQSATFAGVDIAIDDISASARLVGKSETALTITRVNKNADFVDLTALVQEFAQPIEDLLSADSYGVGFELNVTLGGKSYTLSGNLAIDSSHKTHIVATLWDGNLGIVNIDAIVNNGDVYLTVNGVKVAFKLGERDGESVDFGAAMEQLASNEKIAALLKEHGDVAELIQQICTIADNFASFDLSDLDLAQLLTGVQYSDGKLTFNINASTLGLGNFTLVLGVKNDKLQVELKDFTLAKVAIDCAKITLDHETDPIVVPSLKDYMLNVSIDGLGAHVDLVADLYNMDIWAAATYSHEDIQGIRIDEKAYIRFVNNILYVQVNNLKLKFAAASLGDAVSRLTGLLSSGGASKPLDLNSLLAGLTFALASEDHNIVYENDSFRLNVQFQSVSAGEDRYILYFDKASISFGSQQITVEQMQSDTDVQQLDIDEKYVEFTDGNVLIDKVADVLQTLGKLDDGIQAQLNDVDLTIGGVNYKATVQFTYNIGKIKVVFALKDGEQKPIAEGSVIWVEGKDGKDDELYLDINGIKQAVKLEKGKGNGEPFRLADLKTALDGYRGIHTALNAVIDFVSALPDKLTDHKNVTTITDLIGGLTLEDGKITLTIAATKLGLKNDVVLTLSADEKFEQVNISLGKVELADGSVALNINGWLQPYEEIVVPNAEDYVTELKLNLFVDVNDGSVATVSGAPKKQEIVVALRLDLYNNAISGNAQLNGNKINFLFKIKEGDVFVQWGADQKVTKLYFNVYSDIDSVKNSLAKLGVTLPDVKFDGDVKTTVQSLLDSLSYKRTESGYALGIQLQGVAVDVNFKVSDETVTLDKVSVNGEQATVTQVTVGKNGIIELDDDAKNYIDLADVLDDYIDSVKALMNSHNFAITLNGKITLDNMPYEVDVEVQIEGSKLYVNLISVKYDDRVTLVENGHLWFVENTLYLDIGGIRVKVNVPSAPADSSEIAAIANLGSALDGLYGYNDYLDKVLDLIKSIAETDLLNCNFTDMLCLTQTDNALKVSLNGSVWKVSTFTATVQALSNGLQLSVSGFEYENIGFDLSKLSVTTDVSLSDPPSEQEWYTDFDVTVKEEIPDSPEDAKQYKETNNIHVRLDLVSMVVYAQIDSADGGEEYTLYLKYDIANNKLWLSNRIDVNVSVDINDISDIVNEINDIVNKVAKEQHNFELPNLFQGSFDVKSVLETLQFVHDAQKEGVGITLSAMGFDIKALIGNNALTADIDISKIFEGTVVTVHPHYLDDEQSKVEQPDGEKQNSPHTDFVNKINERISGGEVKYVALDEVFDYLFYGANGELDDNKKNNGVMYDLVETNAWRFYFQGNADISIGGSGEYRIAKGSYFIFAFNKSETAFSLKQMLAALGNNNTKQNGYEMLFKLLNTLQLRAKLTIQKQEGDNYKDILYLDIALLRYAGADNKDGAKARLYVHYDTCEPIKAEDGTYSRTGELNVTLSLDALKNVIGLKDALDSVLNGMITNLVNNVKGAIADLQNNKPKLQIGTLARLFTSVSYEGEGKNFELKLNGKTLSDKLGDISLKVSAYGGQDGVGADKRGRGLTLNDFAFSYGDFGIRLTNVIVSASTYTEIKDADGNVTGRDYDYITYGINSYLQDHVAKTGSVDALTVLNPEGALSTIDSFNKSNVAAWGSDKGYNMSNHINLDSIYQLAASLVITAGREDDNGHRSFKIEGPLKLSITIGDWEVKQISIPILFYADIDENGDSYFAVKIHRNNEKLVGVELFGDDGGDSYLTFTTNDGNGKPAFNVYRNSSNSYICPKCGALDNYTVVEENSWKIKHIYRICKECNYKDQLSLVHDWSTTGKMDTEYLGKPGFKDEGISPAEFMANLLGGARSARGYLFDLLNLGSINLLVTKIGLDQTIKDAMNEPTKEFGIEDVLDTGEAYNYGASSSGDMQFEIIANLLSISDGLGTLTVNIHHSGDFNDLYSYNSKTDKWEYDAQKIAAINLSRLEGNIGLAKGFVHIDFDLQHTTPGYGTAWYFTSDLKQMWQNPDVWTEGYSN